MGELLRERTFRAVCIVADDHRDTEPDLFDLRGC
jgi:hypothetical protein